ncbi:MAG: hypothetical protein U0270_17365 [Labilithrix sp.]
MALPVEMIKRAIGTAPSGADARRVVEIACLAVAADGHLAEEELHVLRVLCKELHVDIRAVDEVLAMGSREDRLDRLRAVGGAFESDAAKALAYKMTVLTAVADLATQDEEFEFDLDVQEALGLDSGRADELANQVHEALTPPES